MAKVTWKGVVLAESDDFEEVEKNIYFPPNSVNKEYFKDSDTPYTCPWKGECKYHDVVVNGEINVDAAWEYLDPKKAAMNIKGYMAFDKTKVKIED